MGMLQFIEELEQLLADWPDGEKWTFHEVGEKVNATVPTVIECFTTGLNRVLEVYDPVSRREAELALSALQQRFRFEIEAQDRRRLQMREKALSAYDRAMGKVREKQMDKNYYGSYRTLSYFAGVYESYLPGEVMITVCNDCLRLGFKGGVNKQELASWLQKGVKLCLASEDPDGVGDAKDLLETYGEFFAEGSDSNSATFVDALKTMIDKIIPPTNEFSQPAYNEQVESNILPGIKLGDH